MCAHKHQNIEERISLVRLFQNHSYEVNQYAWLMQQHRRTNRTSQLFHLNLYLKPKTPIQTMSHEDNPPIAFQRQSIA
jgi:hypothetical protein